MWGGKMDDEGAENTGNGVTKTTIKGEDVHSYGTSVDQEQGAEDDHNLEEEDMDVGESGANVTPTVPPAVTSSNSVDLHKTDSEITSPNTCKVSVKGKSMAWRTNEENGEQTQKPNSRPKEHETQQPPHGSSHHKTLDPQPKHYDKQLEDNSDGQRVDSNTKQKLRHRKQKPKGQPETPSQPLERQPETPSQQPKKQQSVSAEQSSLSGRGVTACSSDEDSNGEDEQSKKKEKSVSSCSGCTLRSTCIFIIGVLAAFTIALIILKQYPFSTPIDPEETVEGHGKIMQQLLFVPEMNELMDEWQSKTDDESDDKTMSILVTGKTGVGKSTLINSIIGKRVIPVVDNDLKPATEDVDDYNLTIGDVHVKVWDTHGFQEGATVDETKYLEDMKRNCEKVDLVLYCLRMDDTRMRNGDKDAIVKLTNTFGNSIWDHALFVLTFANKVEPPSRRDHDKLEEYFNGRLEAWTEMLDRILKDTGVELGVKIVRRKVVPAGFEDASLPGREHWLSGLWIKAFHESTSHAKPLLLKINYDRMVATDN